MNYPSPGASRWVVRLDNSPGDKVEEIVDIRPANIVPARMTSFEPEKPILYLHKGECIDSEVVEWLGKGFGSKHKLVLEDGSFVLTDLNECNHAVQRFETAADYERVRKHFCKLLRDENEYVEDAITGRQLRIEEQIFLIQTDPNCGEKARADWKKMSEVKTLAKLLLERSPDRDRGTHHAQPTLVCAGPGAGKTWMLKQLSFLLASELYATTEPGVRLVPITVFVQRIVRYLREANQDLKTLVGRRGLFRWYLKQAYGEKDADMLLQAYQMSAMVILLDGVDEAAGEREVVEEFVHFELVPTGNRIVVTSRPTGVNRVLYDKYWVVMNLLPLTSELQRKVIKMQMRGNQFFDHLMALVPLRQETMPSKEQVEDTFIAQLVETDAYAYFLKLGQFEAEELQEMLQNVLLFLVEASGEPVLLSMLVLIFSDGDEDLTRLPVSRLELYECALKVAIQRRLYQQLQATHASVPGKGAAKEEAIEVAESFKGALGEAVSEGGAAKVEVLLAEQETPEEAAARERAEKRKANRKASTFTGVRDGTRFSTEAKSTELVYAEYTHAQRVLAEDKSQTEFRTIIQKSVPKHMRQDVITLVEECRKPPSSKSQEVGLHMLKLVAVANQLAGRREFSSKDMVVSLAQHTDELITWLALEIDKEKGVALIKTLEQQTRNTPAQYQFTHLSFQEGLYALHLLMVVDKPDWTNWDTDATAADFLNNRYMNNTCRIAAGRLGTLLAQRRPSWDFSAEDTKLSEFGKQALWFVSESNELLEGVNLRENGVGPNDTVGLSTLISGCPKLRMLNLAANGLGSMERQQLRTVARALRGNQTLTKIDLSNNHFGQSGTDLVVSALRECREMRELGMSYNEPGDRCKELVAMIKEHRRLERLSIVEKRKEDLGTRGKMNLGKALTERPEGSRLSFLELDAFSLLEDTSKLEWRTESSQNDAMADANASVLAGVLRTNTTLTALAMAADSKMSEAAQSTIGRAMLNNVHGKVGFLSGFGDAGFDMDESITEHTFNDHILQKAEAVDPFYLFAGVLRANQTVATLTVRELRKEHIKPLSQALCGNTTITSLTLEGSYSSHGNKTELRIELPVQALVGSDVQPMVDLSEAGELGRLSCDLIGQLCADNASLTTLNLSDTAVGRIVVAEGDGEFIFRSLFPATGHSSLHTLYLNNVGLGDAGGKRIFEALGTGLYSRVIALTLDSNELTGVTSGPAMTAYLSLPACSLKHLSLNDNHLDSRLVASCIKGNPSLTNIEFRNNDFSLLQLRAIANFLLAPECQCKLQGIVCNEIQIATDAETLDFSGRALDPIVLLLLAGVLKYNTSLQSLKLANITPAFGPDAAKAMQSGLRANSTLRELDLTGHAINGEGVAAIASGVRESRSLEALTIDASVLPVKSLSGAEPVTCSTCRARASGRSRAS